MPRACRSCVTVASDGASRVSPFPTIEILPSIFQPSSFRFGAQLKSQMSFGAVAVGFDYERHFVSAQLRHFEPQNCGAVVSRMRGKFRRSAQTFNASSRFRSEE